MLKQKNICKCGLYLAEGVCEACGHIEEVEEIKEEDGLGKKAY